MICDTVIDWLQNDQECDVDGVPTCVTKCAEGIYSFQIFKSKYLQMFMEEIDNIREFLDEYKIPSLHPNLYNHHGIILDNFGFN